MKRHSRKMTGRKTSERGLKKKNIQKVVNIALWLPSLHPSIMVNPAEIPPAIPLMLAAALLPSILPAAAIFPCKRRRNIDTQSKDRLLKFFIRKSRFVDWSPLIRNAYIIALLATALLSHLSRNQVLRVYEQYEAIKQYAKEIGTHVVDNTEAMIHDPLKSITVLQMIGILAEVFMYFTLPAMTLTSHFHRFDLSVSQVSLQCP